MKRILIPLVFLLGAISRPVQAQIPVTDVASLAFDQVAHIETIARWAESLSNLRTQINQINTQIGQLGTQINLQTNIRDWVGDPSKAAQSLLINLLGAQDLVREFGQTRNAILGTVDSLKSLNDTGEGLFRAITDADIDGNSLIRDPMLYRRYSALDAVRENSASVKEETKSREEELQADIADTLTAIKSATTDAQVQKLSAKLMALNGQLTQVESARQREVDEVALQKIENDARLEQEKLAAAELEMKDAHAANQRVSSYMKAIKFRQKP